MNNPFLSFCGGMSIGKRFFTYFKYIRDLAADSAIEPGSLAETLSLMSGEPIELSQQRLTQAFQKLNSPPGTYNPKNYRWSIGGLDKLTIDKIREAAVQSQTSPWDYAPLTSRQMREAAERMKVLEKVDEIKAAAPEPPKDRHMSERSGYARLWDPEHIAYEASRPLTEAEQARVEALRSQLANGGSLFSNNLEFPDELLTDGTAWKEITGPLVSQLPDHLRTLKWCGLSDLTGPSWLLQELERQQQERPLDPPFTL